MIVKPPGPLILPALRGHMGDWVYYVALVKLSDLAARVSLAEEIHPSKALNELIQRQVTNRAEEISRYLLKQKQRFFNSLVIAVYGGSPDWYELDIDFARYPAVGDREDQLEGALGILSLDGTEKLFAVDGQHRLTGIKTAVEQQLKLGNEELSVVFVGHKRDPEGMRRTRRLFTTLNRYAKPVSLLEKIAMDEDDIVAIVTRRLANDYWLFKNTISTGKGKQLPPTDKTNITTLPALYDSLNYYLRAGQPLRKWEDYKRLRPDEPKVNEAYSAASSLFDELARNIDPFVELKKEQPPAEVVPKYRSRETGGHLVMRPIGLQMIVSAVRDLIDHGADLAAAVQRVASCPMQLSEEPWLGLLWNPATRRIDNHPNNQRIAKWVLYYGAGGNLADLGKNVSVDKAQQELSQVLYPDQAAPEPVQLRRYAVSLAE